MKKLLLLILPAIIGFISLAQATAYAASTDQSITFDSFTGVYHLSRDSRGLSLLTSNETIVADFPATGYTGIKRILSENYQGHSINIKILGASDAAGSPIPYTVQSDNSNLTLTIGDPSITLIGSQTIRIDYQTQGVVNLNKSMDEFLLNTNGRGWSAPFNKVYATLYIPSQFNSKIQNTPSCYTALNSTKNSDGCQTNISKTNDSTVIIAQASSVSANQALIIKVDFIPRTFTNNHSRLVFDIVLLVLALITVNIGYGLFNKNRKSN